MDAVQHQCREFARLAQTLGERHRGAERILRFLRERAQHRRAEYARRDGEHAHAELGEFARRRQSERGYAALGRGIGGLPDLALEGGDRSGRHDHAALAVGKRRQRLHGGGGEPHHVEAADQVDADDLLEIFQRHRPVAADDALGRPDAGAIDQDARRPMIGGGLLHRRLGGSSVRHVAGHGNAFDAGGHFGGAFFVEIENRHLGAASCERARAGRSQSRCTAGDDGGLSLDFHGPGPLRACDGDRLRG